MRERICLQIQITDHDSREGKAGGSGHMTAEKARRQDLVITHIISSQKQRDMNEHVVACLLTCVQLCSLLICVPGPCLDMCCLKWTVSSWNNQGKWGSPPHTSTNHTSVESLSSRDNPNCLSHGFLPQVVLGCVKLTIKLTFTADKGAC